MVGEARVPAPSVIYGNTPSQSTDLLRIVARPYYQSMNRDRPDPAWRRISPHAFGFDGLRWHVRAWCHEQSGARSSHPENERDERFSPGIPTADMAPN